MQQMFIPDDENLTKFDLDVGTIRIGMGMIEAVTSIFCSLVRFGVFFGTALSQ